MSGVACAIKQDGHSCAPVVVPPKLRRRAQQPPNSRHKHQRKPGHGQDHALRESGNHEAEGEPERDTRAHHEGAHPCRFREAAHSVAAEIDVARQPANHLKDDRHRHVHGDAQPLSAAEIEIKPDHSEGETGDHPCQTIPGYQEESPIRRW